MRDEVRGLASNLDGIQVGAKCRPSSHKGYMVPLAIGSIIGGSAHRKEMKAPTVFTYLDGTLPPNNCATQKFSKPQLAHLDITYKKA